MRHGKSTDTAILIGGALLGAAAMYVLDPEAGPQRRRRLAAAADNACEQARHAVGDTFSRVAGHAGDYTGGLADKAQDIAADLAHRAKAAMPDTGEAVRNWGGSWLDRARDLHGRLHSSLHEHARHIHDDAANRIGGLRDWAMHRGDGARRQVRSWTGDEESHGIGAGTILSSTAGCLAVGAGLMYFLDPHRGRTRRAWIIEKTSECIHRTGQTLRSTGKDVANRLRGTAHDAASAARDYVSQAQVDSEQLVGRIRAEMGHLSDRLGNIQFMADGGGTVTVTGNIAGDELDRLLMLLHRVPGVSHVINRLNVTNAPNPATSPTQG